MNDLKNVAISGHPGMPSMPPSMDQITRSVNKMSFQDNPAHNPASFPPQTMVALFYSFSVIDCVGVHFVNAKHMFRIRIKT